MLCLSLPLKEFFFLRITVHRIVFRQVFLAGFFFWGGGGWGGIVTSPPVVSNRPSLSTNKISFSWSSSSQNLKLFIVSVKGFTGFVCGRNTRRKADSSEKYI